MKIKEGHYDAVTFILQIISDFALIVLIDRLWVAIEIWEYGFSIPTIADTITALIIWWRLAHKIDERIDKFMKKKKITRFPLANKPKVNPAVEALKQASLTELMASIELTVKILQMRGVDIIDWDHKNRALRQVRRIGNGIYFLAETTGEDKGHEEAKEGDA